MSPERQRQIASMGGKAVPAASRSYSRSRAFAVECGRKGGKAVPPEKRVFSYRAGLAKWAGSRSHIGPLLVIHREDDEL